MASKRKGTQKLSQRQQMQNLQHQMCAVTHFDRDEIDSLLKKFQMEVAPGQEKLTRIQFRDILHDEFHMTDDILMDRVFKGFDKDNDSYINAEEWCKGMSVFLRGTPKQVIEFAFYVYDMNSDGYISKDEIFHLLKSSLEGRNLAEEDPDEGVKDLVETLLKKLDKDGDNRVSPQDFETSVLGKKGGSGGEEEKGDRLLLECIGQCLPSQQTIFRWQRAHNMAEKGHEFY